MKFISKFTINVITATNKLYFKAKKSNELRWILIYLK